MDQFPVELEFSETELEQAGLLDSDSQACLPSTSLADPESLQQGLSESASAQLPPDALEQAKKLKTLPTPYPASDRSTVQVHEAGSLSEEALFVPQQGQIQGPPSAPNEAQQGQTSALDKAGSKKQTNRQYQKRFRERAQVSVLLLCIVHFKRMHLQLFAPSKHGGSSYVFEQRQSQTKHSSLQARAQANAIKLAQTTAELQAVKKQQQELTQLLMKARVGSRQSVASQVGPETHLAQHKALYGVPC